MYSKRGQVTIFIILAVLIIGGVALFFTLKGGIHKESSLAPEVVSLKKEIQNCLDDSLQRTILTNSFQGGYFSLNVDHLIYTDEDLFFESKIPYYIIDNQIMIPSKETMENEIFSGIKGSFENCLNHLPFGHNFTYNYKDFEINISLDKNYILTDVKLPFEISYGNSSTILEDFSSRLDVPYFEMYTLAKNLSESQIKDIHQICISCIANFDENSKYSIYPYELRDEKSFIFINSIQDSDTGIIFNFAYKFNLEALEKK